MKAVLWFCVVLAVGFYITGPIQDPDLWWHIATGRWVLANMALPHEDVWGMFSHGQPWRAYSWSNAVVYALADRWWGIEGLLSLKFSLAVVLCLSLSAVCGLIARNWFLGLLLGVVATAGCYNHFTLRPQSLVWVLFAWLLLVSDRIEREGLTHGRRASLFMLMMVWANTHLSAVLGLAAIAAWTYGLGKSPQQPAIRRSGESFSWGFLGTLCTPYLGGEWITFLSKTSHPSEFRVVAEFQPATVMQFPTAFLLVGGMVLLFLSLGRIGRLPIAKALLWVGFVLGGLAFVKFLPFAIIVTAALTARAIADLNAQESIKLEPVRNIMHGFDRLYGVVDKIPREGLSFVFLCLAIVSVFRVWSNPIALEVVPQHAVDFIEAKNLPMPLANVFGHGGYLIYRFSDQEGEPRTRVAIDGRTNLISKDLWARYSATATGKRNWREYLEQIDPGTILWREDSPLPAILLAENRWCLVFESGPDRAKVSVWVKRDYFEAHRETLSSINCS